MGRSAGWVQEQRGARHCTRRDVDATRRWVYGPKYGQNSWLHSPLRNTAMSNQAVSVIAGQLHLVVSHILAPGSPR